MRKVYFDTTHSSIYNIIITFEHTHIFVESDERIQRRKTRKTKTKNTATTREQMSRREKWVKIEQETVKKRDLLGTTASHSQNQALKSQ